ncbi:C40 family peptidase [Luteimonas sp. A611]
MTRPTAPSGRTRHRSNPARHGKFVALCGCLLSLAALPAFAGPGLAGDSADTLAAPSASVTRTLVSNPLRTTSQDVLFASDVNALIAQAAAIEAAQASPKEEEGRVQTLLKRGLALLGTPYRWGGNSPEGGFDCSGLVGYVFRTALGVELPRVSRDMARDGEKVERTALVPGDLVFFGRRGKRVDHVGIYIGEGRFLHAPRTGRDVTVSQLDTGYWSGRFLQARRVAGLGTES